MDQRGKSGHGWMPLMTVSAIGLSFTAGLVAANPVTIPVRVTFVDPATFSEPNAPESGSPDQNLGSSETQTVIQESIVTDPAGEDEGSFDVTVIYK